jgi:hypothetical protein
MERIFKINKNELNKFVSLTPQQRLKQANCAFRLYYSIHHPYSKPIIKFFDSFKEFAKYEDLLKTKKTDRSKDKQDLELLIQANKKSK